MNLTSAKLTLIAPDRVCWDPHWQGTTNAVHAVLHDESVPEADLVRLFPRRQSPWGLSIQAPYAPPRPSENEFETLTAHLRAEGAHVHPYKLGAFTQSGPAAAAPLKTIAEGVEASSFFLRLGEGQTDPVRLTAYVTLRGIILAEARLEVPASAMGGSEVVSRQAAAFAKIFVSYAREDLWVVELTDACCSPQGLAEYRWDLKVLKSGDKWAEVIYDEIRNADSFQLFWSEAAGVSPYVKKEWEYAMELKREGFIKPVYWQDPLAPQPPHELSDFHFARIPLPPWLLQAAPAVKEEAPPKKKAAGKSRARRKAD